MIFIEKTIFVRDRNQVKRQAFMAGDEVEEAVYHAVLSTNSVVNPDDLPELGVKKAFSTASRGIETKVLEPQQLEREVSLEIEAEVEKQEAENELPQGSHAKGTSLENEIETEDSVVVKRGRKKKSVD